MGHRRYRRRAGRAGELAVEPRPHPASQQQPTFRAQCKSRSFPPACHCQANQAPPPPPPPGGPSNPGRKLQATFWRTLLPAQVARFPARSPGGDVGWGSCLCPRIPGSSRHRQHHLVHTAPHNQLAHELNTHWDLLPDLAHPNPLVCHTRPVSAIHVNARQGQ